MQEALERHTAAIERQNELLTRLIAALGSGAFLVGEALGAAPAETEARLRALEAAIALDPPAVAEPRARSAPLATAE